jgi:HSP20 family molecular chaperone IbpA
VSRKLGGSRSRQKSSVEVRDEGGAAARRTGHVLLLDLPVDSACQPLSDVVEVDDAVRVLLEIPGVPAASVRVRVLGNRLEVTGEKIPDFPPGETSFLCLERIFGKFQHATEVSG